MRTTSAGGFAACGGSEPLILQADVANAEDVAASLVAVRRRFDRIEAFISNASAAVVVNDLDDYSARGLHKSIDYGAWPLWEHTRRIKELFGAWPRYVIGMSSTGPDHFTAGYDFVAASKAVLETLCRYLSYRLRDEDTRLNIIRSRAVRTASFNSTFGDAAAAFARRYMAEREFISPDEVGEAALALASGLFDAMRGQVLTVDRGTTFSDRIMRRYDERVGNALRTVNGAAGLTL